MKRKSQELASMSLAFMILVSCFEPDKDGNPNDTIPGVESTEGKADIGAPSKDASSKASDDKVEVSETAHVKAEVDGTPIATCILSSRNPNFMLCSSDKVVVLRSFKMDAHPELVGKLVELKVSFKGLVKAGGVFSIKAGNDMKQEIPDGNDPVVSMLVRVSGDFDLTMESSLENNPHLMDKDFAMSLRDMEIEIISE